MSELGKFIVIALLSCSITTIVSIIYITLCCFALIYRFDCSTAQTIVHNSDYLLILVYRQYIKDDTCFGSLAIPDLMHSDTVFVLISVSLAFSAASLLAALSLIVAIFNKECWYYLDFGTYVHTGFCVATFVVDMTFAIHFGLDYTKLTDRLNADILDEPTKYLIDMLRIGAFLLIVLTMKGFVAHAINLPLLVPLIYYLLRINTEQKEPKNHIQEVLNVSTRDSESWPIQNVAATNLEPVKNVQPSNIQNEEVSQTSDCEFLPVSSLQGHSKPQAHFGISPHRPFTYSEGLTPTMLRSKSPKPPKPYTPNPDYGQ
ncbi:PREDICTED: uncharacterized protein LOC106117082 [Papilio xuthus]|uniref:Uncharacterized protein LOC106117082 n=1 Tax=Papilio xuthus TaxID=66420 RepID=A0AAJ7E836_PAPXU|nr:PREDICTED: uncharacterized protein LOC106117082 [Papilio xuthus]